MQLNKGTPSYLLAALLCAGLGTASCSQKTPQAPAVVDAGPPVLMEKEPNDSAASALRIDRTASVEANLGADPSAPDVDWYALSSAQPKTVQLTVSCPPGADVALEVVDETGTVLSSVNDSNIGAAERLPNLNLSGKAWVRITGLKKGAGGAYTLSVQFLDLAPGAELEPNDRRVDATTVALGLSVSGFLSHTSDSDWYRYELPSANSDEPAPSQAIVDSGQPPPSTLAGDDAGLEQAQAAGLEDAGSKAAPPERRLALRIDVSAVEAVALDVQVLTEAEAVLMAAQSGIGAPLSLRNVGVRELDRVLYVVVRSGPVGTGKDAKRGANALTAYTLSVASEEAGSSAEYEPNDDTSKATELPANSYREGFISPKGDVDTFRLVTQGPSLAKLALTGVEKVDVVLSVVRIVEGKPDEVVLKANEGGVKEPEQLNNVFCDGSCFIRVEAAPRKVNGKWSKEDENADQSYRLSATVIADDGSEEHEPNGTAVTATPLGPSKSMRGTVFPRQDTDFFSVDLTTRSVKTPLVATLLGILKVDVGLYLHRVESDGSLTLVQTSDSGKRDKSEVIRYSADPGLYVFEVRDSKNREANFQDSYQLTVAEGD